MMSSVSLKALETAEVRFAIPAPQMDMNRPNFDNKGLRRKEHTAAARPPRTRAHSRGGAASATGPLRRPDLQQLVFGLELDFASLKVENERLLLEVSKLRHSHEHFEKIFDQTPACLLLVNELGAILEMNAAARRLLQLRKAQLLPDFFGQFVQHGKLAEFLTLLRECKLTGKARSAILPLAGQGAKPTFIRVIVAPFHHLSPGKIRQFCVMLEDQSARLEAERLVSERESASQDFLDSMDAILWEADADTLRRTYVSKHVERMLGYTSAQWVSEADFWQKRVPVDDRERVLNLVRRSIAERKGFGCEYRLYTKDRRMLWVRDRVTIVEDGRKLKLRGVTLDITETKVIQEELQQAHKKLEERVEERTAELQTTIRELEAFSYTLSHDLRAPLRSMHGYAELVQELCAEKLPPDAMEYLNRIRTSSYRLDLLIQDVLKYSKISQGPIELHAIEPEALINEVLSEYPVFKSGGANICVEKPLLPVMGHEGFLTQCIANLLSNAVKFVPKDRKPRVRVYTSSFGEQVRLCFEDNGIGIEPKDQRRIFRIFQRLHPAKEFEGTGIGLAIVQRAAERMGGQAGVDSVPGRGSTFWLQLRKGAV